MALAAHAASAGGSEAVWPSGRVKATRKKYAKPTANPTPTLAHALGGELERPRAGELPARAVPDGGLGLDQARKSEVGIELVDGEAPERLLARRHAIDVVEAGAPVEPDLAPHEHAGRAAP